MMSFYVLNYVLNYILLLMQSMLSSGDDEIKMGVPLGHHVPDTL